MFVGKFLASLLKSELLERFQIPWHKFLCLKPRLGIKKLHFLFFGCINRSHAAWHTAWHIKTLPAIQPLFRDRSIIRLISLSPDSICQVSIPLMIAAAVRAYILDRFVYHLIRDFVQSIDRSINHILNHFSPMN